MRSKVFLFLAALAGLAVAVLYLAAQPNVSAPHVPKQTAAIGSASKSAALPGRPIKVARVVDGDTVILENGDYLRYIGIDTPEEVDARKPVQCFAAEAAARNKELVEGKTITFYKDVNEKDKYDRWLGFVYLSDGTLVNLELVRQGYAFAYPYPPDISKVEAFSAAEEYARTNHLGLWGGECAIKTLKTGRKQTNSL